jgi:hypothetical protein
VSKALAASNPALSVAGALASPAMRSLERPDPEGTAQLYAQGKQTSMTLVKKQDELTPNWNVQWSNVTLDESVRLRVMIDDADLVNNDDMGSFDISAVQLQQALRSGASMRVPVSGQTSRQILFAEISVIPAR